LSDINLKMNKPPTLPRHESGISLIESLVALLVLALGILGMAGLQTRSLVDTRTTNARAVAASMVDDLSERMQFNTGAQLLPANPYLVAWGVLPANPGCRPGPCTPQQIAAMDLSEWKQTLGALLPRGDAAVFQSPLDPTQIGVLIGWTDNVSDQANAAGDGGRFIAPQTINTGVAGQACPDGLICHLVYIRP
jgi:type IV pilus assembly protein PilV